MKNETLSLNKVSSYLKQRLTQTLPGSAAHELMRAQPVGNLRPAFKNEDPPKPGGVLILLYEAEGRIKFPLIKRPEYAGTHGGQVSFPGGKAEQGEDRVIAALREGEEEIGIRRELVRVIGRLTDFHVIPSNFLVTPVIGILEREAEFVPDAVEVARIIPVALDDLIKENALLNGEITVGGVYRLNAPHFLIDGEMVWGATAMILNEFRSILNEMD
ncbi:MAG TPA: CoA pyrophosphatase [Cyclobacteriaceae bacterium]|nr:CoA pyrophosphatase [Cyclobacteriaceae bacterium]